ncbi:DUF421 domain-containing protein [Lentibacillus sp. Marseille-P4043]|uniref:DUF421 domain-containing protein n=1 Tax=Lentibacillus sp. Marseille-P4043 TaxID=2040293 RepID=UPI000D0BDC2A|nr:DUF421 domain-containing protein [Lentibacillus sp. Marseille-P4043]
MDLDVIWKAVLIVIVGTFLLRIGGRKSISQMTLPQTVIMIAIGSLLIQPVSGKNIWVTFAVGGILVLTLIGFEYAQLKFDGAEKLVTGNAKVVINNGTLNENNLRKLRLTVDQLEIKLRQKNVTKISDVKWATLEPNGQIGFTLKQEAQPVTKKEFQKLTTDMQTLQQTINQLVANPPLYSPPSSNSNKEGLFTEVETNQHENPPPKHLQ